MRGENKKLGGRKKGGQPRKDVRMVKKSSERQLQNLLSVARLFSARYIVKFPVQEVDIGY